MDMTNEARIGYDAARYSFMPQTNPYIHSSASAIAWALGYWLEKTHRSMPRNVRMSRGYTIRANDMLMKWLGGNEFERIN